MTDLPYHKIFIRTDASRTLGMGHIYRCLALWEEMKDHEAVIFVSKDAPLGADLYRERGATHEIIENDSKFISLCKERCPELVIIDMLDTEKPYINALKGTGAKVVTFEDLGSGAQEADLIVNDLYKNVHVSKEKQLSGLANAIISPLFEAVQPAPLRKEINHILITYGGTDPAHLTEHALAGLQRIGYKGHVTVILGPGRPEEGVALEAFDLHGEVLKNVSDMPEVMRKADMAMCSAGRTITEFMTLGIPMLVMCQNMKELMHTHANCQYGAINLGLGTHVSVDTLAAHIELFIDYKLRKTLHERALYEIAERSNHNVVTRIISCLGEA